MEKYEGAVYNNLGTTMQMYLGGLCTKLLQSSRDHRCVPGTI